jgi:hypothetical protein
MGYGAELAFALLATAPNLLKGSVVHPDPAGSEISCNLGSGSVINSGSDSGSKFSFVSN